MGGISLIAIKLANPKAVPLIILICLAVTWLSLVPTSSQAQGPDPMWHKITDLTAQVQSTSFLPKIAADSAGNLHVVWQGYTNPEQDTSPFAANAIFYTRWNGESWSQPIDILFDERNASSPVIYIDNLWRIHVYWDSSKGIKHSWAWFDEAQAASKWHTKSVVPHQRTFALATEGDGTVHMVYVDWEGSVRLKYITSHDEGMNWGSAETVAIVGDPAEVAINTVSMAVDLEGRVHAAWSVSTRARGWSPESLWYAHSLNVGKGGWSEPLLIDNDPNAPLRPGVFVATEPLLAVAPDNTLHLFWHRGVYYKDGRFHVESSDGGDTWSEKRPSFPGYRGSTGNDSVVFDSTGMLHLLMSAAPADGSSRVYYSAFKNGQWSPLEYIDFGEHPSAVITYGNRLNFVFRRRGGSGISYTWRQIDAPYLEPMEQSPPRVHMATPTLTATVLSHAVIGTKVTSTGVPESTITPGPTATHLRESKDTPHLALDDRPVSSNSPIFPLAAGAVSSVVIVAIAVAWQWRRNRL